MVVFGVLGWQIGTLLDSDTSQVRLVLVLTLAGAALVHSLLPILPLYLITMLANWLNYCPS